jgi:two-component system nitrate/nitrite response regulator NarL
MKNIKLLLVDDHQIILDGITSFLEKDPEINIIGYALNGKLAIDFLANNSADVVLLDISMPVLDGIETAKQIRRDFPNIKIILLTMQGDGHYILNAMRLGVHGYVVKEKSKEVLVTAIHSVFGGSSYWSPDLMPRIADAQLLSNNDVEQGSLTSRELEIICEMVEDPSKTAKEIGDKLNIAEVTVQTHIRNAKQKLSFHKAGELIKYVTDRNLCPKK